MKHLKIKNWEKWQTYRSDRGQPPWIKIHRRIRLNPEWVELSDAERGQLVAIWLLAADKDGVIPASPQLIQKLCFMTKPPNINKFTDLGFIENGWRQDDVKMTSECQPDGRPKEEKRREDKIYVENNFYLTYKKRKLIGKRLDTFLEFWDAFNYKTGKANAADSWLDIPSLTNELVKKIIKMAKIEAQKRPQLILNGKTPKMAQGWLSSKRWEDEIIIEKQEEPNGYQPPLEEILA